MVDECRSPECEDECQVCLHKGYPPCHPGECYLYEPPKQLPAPYEAPIEGEFVGREGEQFRYYDGLLNLLRRRMRTHDDMVDSCMYTFEHLIMYGRAARSSPTGRIQPKEDRVLFVTGDHLRIIDSLTALKGETVVVGIDMGREDSKSAVFRVLYGGRPDLIIYDDITSLVPLPKEEPLSGKAKHTAELNKMRVKMRGKRRW